MERSYQHSFSQMQFSAFNNNSAFHTKTAVVISPHSHVSEKEPPKYPQPKKWREDGSSFSSITPFSIPPPLSTLESQHTQDFPLPPLLWAQVMQQVVRSSAIGKRKSEDRVQYFFSFFFRCGKTRVCGASAAVKEIMIIHFHHPPSFDTPPPPVCTKEGEKPKLLAPGCIYFSIFLFFHEQCGM